MAFSPFWNFAIAIIIAIISIVYSVYHTSLLSTISPSLHANICRSAAETTHPGYLGYECVEKPHYSSWDAWWHPQRSQDSNAKSKDAAGVITKDWNILYHLGGNGPWVEKVIDVVEGGVATPKGCEVVQVHMVRFRSSLHLPELFYASIGLSAGTFLRGFHKRFANVLCKDGAAW